MQNKDYFHFKPTPLERDNLQDKIHSVYDYRCQVASGTRYFILGLGVSVQQVILGGNTGSFQKQTTCSIQRKVCIIAGGWWNEIFCRPGIVKTINNTSAISTTLLVIRLSVMKIKFFQRKKNLVQNNLLFRTYFLFYRDHMYTSGMANPTVDGRSQKAVTCDYQEIHCLKQNYCRN